MSNRNSAALENEVVKLYSEGVETSVIQNKLGITTDAIYYIAKKHGLRRRSVGKQISLRKKILDLNTAGLSPTDIALQLNCSSAWVYTILRSTSHQVSEKKIVMSTSIVSASSLKQTITSLSNDLLILAAQLEEAAKGLESLDLLEKSLDRHVELMRKYDDIKREKQALITKLASRAQVVYGEKSLNG